MNELIATGMGEFTTEMVVSGLSNVSKQVKDSVVTISRNECRFLVDTYYQCQDARITADGQIRSIVQNADEQGEKIPLALKWVSANMRNQELQIKKMLEKYAGSLPVGRWALDTMGIGPVLAAGCLSYFDINKVKHYGQFLSYCGLNDYNNPWLGKDAAAKLVKKIYDELKETDAITAAKLDGCVDEEWAKKFFKKLSKADSYGAGTIRDMCSTDDTARELYESLLQEYCGMDGTDDCDMDAADDYIIRNYVKADAVTEFVILRVIAETGRNRDVVMNGLSKMKKKNANGKSPRLQYTKTELSGYLAKPPYNQDAKQLVYLIGEAFVKVSNKPDSLYGKLYRERKAYESLNNEKGVYKDLAEEALSKKKYGEETESYKAYIQGRLPKVQIHRRCKRYAVKIFISHLFEAMYRDKYKRVPCTIYPIAHMEHTDYIPPEVPFDRYIKI